MNRRAFLCHLTTLAAGHLLGLPALARALDLAAPAAAPRLALIIDDIGFSCRRLERFLGLELPLTFAVLPRLAHSAQAGVMIAHAGHEVLLHQPMQPIHRQFDPGPGALYVGDGPEHIRHVLSANIDSLPQAIGANNHMGSLFTGSQPEIRRALEVIRDSGLFFIDSLTSHRSEAFQTARRLQLPSSRRNVFLDNRPQVPYIMGQLKRLTALARQNGLAIGVGHPHEQTAEAIGRFAPRWRQAGVELVHCSRIVNC